MNKSTVLLDFYRELKSSVKGGIKYNSILIQSDADAVFNASWACPKDYLFY